MGRIGIDNVPVTIELVDDEGPVRLRYVDERFLPDRLVIAETRDWREVVGAVKNLAVRGAPAIGLAGASALALWAIENAHEATGNDMREVAREIAGARPTAVNLKWALEQALRQVEGAPAENVGRLLVQVVKQMQAEDEMANRAIGAFGATLIGAGARLLTHCNAGSLATYHYGTALGVVYAAHELGKVERVYADETRPVGQGARLTAWELARAGVPVTVICDNMAASLMAQGAVDAVIVGADRIAANGDVANKIGTYSVALAAHAHGIPFYVAAPTSTFDLSMPDGSHIPIEQRAAGEVLPNPIEGVEVWNPAFDVTPSRLVSAFITEKGIFEPSQLPSEF